MLSQEEEEADLQRLLNNPSQHTPTNPFCFNPTCPCRHNKREVEILTSYVQAGLASENDTTIIFQGRNIR